MKILLFISMLGISMSLTAQADWNCGTKQTRRLPAGYAGINTGFVSRSDTNTIYIPVTLNIVGKDDGSGYYELSKMYVALCKLNTDFASHNIQFYIEGLPRYINSSMLFDMVPPFAFSDSMRTVLGTYNTPNTMNLYSVNTAMGYSFVSFHDLDYDNSTYPPSMHNAQKHAVVMARDHLDDLDHILTHEVGHFLGLWHTFVGWEGYNYNDFAGDVPDTLFLSVYVAEEDSTYILPWLVEHADSSNCTIAGDLICDTSPDYLSIGFFCNEESKSAIIQMDPKGNAFQSDGTYYMSYANDACKNRFSPGQVTWMRDVAQGPRSYLLYDQMVPDSFVAQEVHFIYPPKDSTVEVFDSVTLEWEAVPGADYYLFEFGRKLNSTFYFTIVKETLVLETSFTVGVNLNFNYYWKVTPVARYHPCTVVTDTSFFRTEPFTATKEIKALQPLLLYPNPVSTRLHWRLPDMATQYQSLNIELFDAQGRRIHSSFNMERQTLETGDLSKGVYTLKLTGKDKMYIGRFVKQ